MFNRSCHAALYAGRPWLKNNNKKHTQKSEPEKHIKKKKPEIMEQ